MKIDLTKTCEIDKTTRVELLGSMFEVPIEEKLSVSLSGLIELDRPYNIGLIVGPSGSGKTLLLEHLFGTPEQFQWESRSVIDDFPKFQTMEKIARVCQSVGFNTIPAWMRPFAVLSNGEKFRATVARHLLSNRNPISLDEFTSVVDRQVAQFACFSIQKYIREFNLQMVVASCHYDIIDWLQPDWILEPGNPCRLTWRSLQQRPPITVSVSRVEYETWKLFRQFHYMSADLNPAARCYGLFVHARTGESSSQVGRGNMGSSQTGESSTSLSSTAKTENGYSNGDFGRENENAGGSTDAPLLVEASLPADMELGFQPVQPNLRILTNRDERITATCEQTRIPSGGDRLRCGDQSMVHDAGGLGQRPGSRIASMCGILHRPHPKVSDIAGFSRMVTLPDFQGLGLALFLANTLGSAYKALGKRLHSYPNHPAWIRSYQRSKMWLEVKAAGTFSPRRGATSSVGGFGGRRCAVFMYIGPAMNHEEAERLVYAGAFK